MTDGTTDVRNIASAGFSRRTLMKTGIGAIAAPAVLRVIPANAQSKIITDRIAREAAHRTIIIGELVKRGKQITVGGKEYEATPRAS